jgi:large subunit ribosomal protein L10
MPSASVLESKKQIVADFSERVKNSVAGVVVSYQGITVADDTALRKELREAGVEYSVIKNTLAKRAFEENGYKKLFDDLNGMTAFATSANDQVVAAKILKKYADKVETFELKSGYVDGEVLDKAGIEALANIPAKEVLIGKILGSLQSSLYGLAFVLQAIVDKSGEAGTEEAPAVEPAAEETKEEAPASTEEPTA